MSVSNSCFCFVSQPGATARLFTLFLAFSFFAQPVKANVFGEDDRRPVTQEDELGFVGVIACANTGRIPTASLVTVADADPARHFDIIVTVAHAFSNSDGQRWEECIFRLEGKNEREARIVYVMSGTHTPGQGWNTDWAVAVLADRLSEGMTLPHPLVLDETETLERINDGARVLLVGHNGERLPMLVSENCGPHIKVSGSHNFGDDRVFNHDCDMMAGWSGGPLLLRKSDTTHITAVNATQFNRVVHQQGWPFDGRFNPNTAIRIDEKFEAAIRTLALNGAPIQLADKIAFCSIETAASCDVAASDGSSERQ